MAKSMHTGGKWKTGSQLYWYGGAVNETMEAEEHRNTLENKKVTMPGPGFKRHQLECYTKF